MFRLVSRRPLRPVSQLNAEARLIGPRRRNEKENGSLSQKPFLVAKLGQMRKTPRSIFTWGSSSAVFINGISIARTSIRQMVSRSRSVWGHRHRFMIPLSRTPRSDSRFLLPRTARRRPQLYDISVELDLYYLYHSLRTLLKPDRFTVVSMSHLTILQLAIHSLETISLSESIDQCLQSNVVQGSESSTRTDLPLVYPAVVPLT